MRLAALAFVALLAGKALASETDAGERAPSARAHSGVAEAVVQVAFPHGSPFPKPRPPELRVEDAKSGLLIKSVRAQAWTKRTATYAMALPAGRTYSVRWTLPGHTGSFGEFALAEDAAGKVTYRIPYVPKAAASRSLPAGATASR
jgi:hypothetical protein